MKWGVRHHKPVIIPEKPQDAGVAMFRFKSFTVADDQCAMKVGTDAVLLGAWADNPLHGPILDIGCGSGIIGLMMAQRFAGSQVYGVELEPQAANQARQNVLQSPYAQRIQIVCGAAQQLLVAQCAFPPFTAIVCNPPYFCDALAPTDPLRHQARHATQLTLAELFTSAAHVLHPQGRFSVVFPAADQSLLLDAARDTGWYVAARLAVVTREGRAPRRVLLAFVRQPVSWIDEQQLVLHGAGGCAYSDAFKALTANFYLRH